MKQTAVEWLVKYLTLHRIELSNNAIQNVINVAKEMEKQQIIEAHKIATLEAGFEMSAEDWANEYYTRNYEKTSGTI